MFETVFRDLDITFPFNGFEVKPCRHFEWCATACGWSRPPQSFHTTMWSVWGKRPGRSLTDVPKSYLFNAYYASYKGFKGGFCKVRVKDGVPLGAFVVTGQEFLLYGRQPNKFNGWAHENMSTSDLANLDDLYKLHQGLNCWEVVKICFLCTPVQDLA
ncbi:hypothetical protein CR513_50907, partial [Mucuna pruriens]